MNPALDPAAGRHRTLRALRTPPLTWWRVLPPEALDPTAQRRLRAALVTAPPLPSPAWAAACRADPAAAIRVAITALAEAVAVPGRVDPAMSAVCLCAVRGNPACIDLLVHVLDRRARRRASLDALCLAQTWRTVSRHGLGRADTAR